MKAARLETTSIAQVDLEGIASILTAMSEVAHTEGIAALSGMEEQIDDPAARLSALYEAADTQRAYIRLTSPSQKSRKFSGERIRSGMG